MMRMLRDRTGCCDCRIAVCWSGRLRRAAEHCLSALRMTGGGMRGGARAAVDRPRTPNDVVQTPHIDRVAKDGVLFRHAFVDAAVVYAVPQFAAVRAVLLCDRSRGDSQWGRWDASIPSWPLLLKDAGYGVGQNVEGLDARHTHQRAGSYGAGKFGYEKAGGAFNGFSENVTKLVADGTPLDEAKTRMYASVRDNFSAFLADRKPDQPFCYWFGPTNVHRTWVKGSGKALWNIEPDAHEGEVAAVPPRCS